MKMYILFCGRLRTNQCSSNYCIQSECPACLSTYRFPNIIHATWHHDFCI